MRSGPSGWKWCFNPHLPFPGGEASVASLEVTISQVSIHTSRFREVKPERCIQSGKKRPFQSTPPVSGR